MSKKHSIADDWNMSTAIGLCAAVGIAPGALLQNPDLWLCGGAGVGVVPGTVTQMSGKKKQ